MSQPSLRTERLLLVPLDDRHLDLEVRLDSDPEVLRYISGRAHTRDEVTQRHRERMDLAQKIDGLGYWTAYCTDGGVRGAASPASETDAEFVGLMMLPPAQGPDQPDDPNVAELGYRLARRFWRRGLASEASRELLRHAFETVGIERVIAQTMAINAGSRGVMESIGMRFVRTFFPQGDEPAPGADAGEVEYGITRAMWDSLGPHTLRS